MELPAAAVIRATRAPRTPRRLRAERAKIAKVSARTAARRKTRGKTRGGIINYVGLVVAVPMIDVAHLTVEWVQRANVATTETNRTEPHARARFNYPAWRRTPRSRATGRSNTARALCVFRVFRSDSPQRPRSLLHSGTRVFIRFRYVAAGVR